MVISVDIFFILFCFFVLLEHFVRNQFLQQCKLGMRKVVTSHEKSIKNVIEGFLIQYFFLGIKNMMVVRIGGINRINVSSIRLDFVNIQGKVLQANIPTDKLGSDDVRNATIIPPVVAFRMKLSGNYHIFDIKSIMQKIKLKFLEVGGCP